MNSTARLLSLGLLTSLVLGTLGACGGGTSMVPPPRTVVIFSGERLQADQEAMTEVDGWLRVQQEDIRRNPDFLIRFQTSTEPGYPWTDFEIEGDTANIFLHQVARDAEAPFSIYAHLRLMAERDELEPWLPEEDLDKTGFELELAIVDRVADVWLLGRSVYDTQAFGPLDEIMYAREGGFLRELLLKAQPERFAEERDAYFEENPAREEEFTAWMERVFERSEPGYVRTETTADEGDEGPGF